MHLLLLNVGNSDVLADGTRPTPARTAGKALWDSYEHHTFDVPIIRPCLDFLLGKRGATIENIVLFDIDQHERGAALETDRHGVKFRDKDTIWFGRIIERWLGEHYGDRIGTIERRDIRDINPSLYDDAFDEYGRQLASLYDPQITICSVLMAGGIPACNTALQLQAISRFGDRCRTIYQPENDEPYELRVGQQVQAAFRKASAIDALARHDFTTALTLLESEAALGITALLRYARDRESFDFERAQAEIEHGITAASGATRTFLLGLRHSLDDMIEREQFGPLLLELHANASIAYKNGRYADFLGRMFRFQEATQRYIVETHMDLPTDIGGGKRDETLAQWNAGIVNNSMLKAYLDAFTIAGKPLKYHEPNTAVFAAMLTYLVDQKAGQRMDGSPYLKAADRERFEQIRKSLNRFDDLKKLRNQSIIAHGFAGISLQKIKEAYKDGDPLHDIEKILHRLGFRMGENVFARIADFVTDQLRRGV